MSIIISTILKRHSFLQRPDKSCLISIGYQNLDCIKNFLFYILYQILASQLKPILHFAPQEAVQVSQFSSKKPCINQD
ncbi:unnamed protein product [Paramecium octaurelia]|uniref:Uncharacterized protein n=1 Tax=Paramecium octaurelia TaxID=43137 RepID=A0A8S1XKP8_PAROT|nr:unnamed protein product [Paramecium octaurelia]